MSGLLDLDAISATYRTAANYDRWPVGRWMDDIAALLNECRRLRALELRVRALTTEPGCRHDGETYCGNAILEALDDPIPTPPVRPVDGGNP